MLRQKFLMAFILGVIVLELACSSKPTVVEPIQSNDTAAVIEETAKMILQARDEQVDVLAPISYNKAKETLTKAISEKQKGKSNNEVLTLVSYSRGWLAQGNQSAQIATILIKGIREARGAALKAKANEILPVEWGRAGGSLENLCKEIENGVTAHAQINGPDIVISYQKLERDALIKTYLAQAQKNLEMAKKEKAKKIAPKSYFAALNKYEDVATMIYANPQNTEPIKMAAAEANRESVHLLDVTSKVKAGASEDQVLQSELKEK